MFAGSPLVIVWFLGHSLFTSAQTTNVTCAADHKWAFNSEQQSPCAVASSLLAVCTGCATLWFIPCLRNVAYARTVQYPCGAFGRPTVPQFPSTVFNVQPSFSFPDPIPAGLHVPGWAYLDVKASDMFNESLAEANANITESTAIPQPTKTSSSSTTSTSSAAFQTTTVAAVSDTTVVNQTRSNAIGGGIVGAFFALVLLGGLGFWIYRRRRVARTKGAILDSPVMSQHQTDTLPSQLPVPSITVSSLNSQPGSGSIRSGQTV
ncbi:hypothetical protein DFH07DRAFT_783270 [Mycena maculata]|uniref:Transmembrane protein n=1 Tax=Mycena maculata TaxID=230809 RepID=A0AAD7HPF8_9AGAR|nr:hypothetical protein DFH07DRAFT_783270 [Mycena maculata]